MTDPLALELERRVYGPHPDPEAVARLAALLAAERRDATDEPADEVVDEPDAEVAAPRRRARLLLPVAGVLAVVALVAALAPRSDSTSVPVPTPSASVLPDGDTLVAFSRPSQPGTTATTITYQPNGYALIDPRGAGLRAEMTCSGVGTVHVNLTDGTRFVFQCTQRQIDDQVQVDPQPHTHPFLVVAATTGNVVWDLKISAVTDSWRADLD